MKKILVICLGKSFGIPLYANEVTLRFPDESYDYWTSKFSVYRTDCDKKIQIVTYTNKLTFIFSTLFVLPFYLIKLVFTIHRYKCLYIPGGHLWDIFFVITFRTFGKKVFYTLHDSILHKGESNILLQKLIDITIILSTNLIFLTDHVRKMTFEYHEIKKDFEIIPLGLFYLKGVKENYSFSNQNRVLFLGRIIKYKGVEMLVKAMENIKNIDFNLIIAGKSNYSISIPKNSRITLEDKILSDEEVAKYLNWADILVLPYIEASQSALIVSGIVAEIPMVCTRVGGLVEQLKEDECVFVEPNEKAISEGIIRLLTNKKLMYELKDKLKNKKAELSWDSISNKIFSYINTNTE